MKQKESCKKCGYCYYKRGNSKGYCNLGLGTVYFSGGIPINCPKKEAKESVKIAERDER